MGKLLFKLGIHIFLVSISLPIVCLQQTEGNLPAYEIASFANPIIPGEALTSRLDHFTVHQQTGDVYVGAVNYLYRLDEHLAQAVNKSTASCVGEDCTNYNKVLVLHGGRLITCGSEFDGSCQMRLEGNLDADDGNKESQDLKVASVGAASTESIVARDSENIQRLYVAATYSNTRADIPPISRRLLVAGLGFMITEDDNRIQFTIDYKGSSFPITYVSVFTWKEFTYFVTCQENDIGDETIVSKINRVCQTSDNFDSYTEIRIECAGSDGSVFSLVQAAHVGPAGADLAASMGVGDDDQVLYAVFAKNQGSSNVPIEDSALCVYKMIDIETEFTTSVTNCITGDNAYNTGYLQSSFCGSTSLPVPPNLYNCDAQGYKYADGIMDNPLGCTALVEFPNHLTSSIVTNIELNHTVAFIGTSQGQLLKVHVESDSVARLYEQIRVDDSPVMRDTVINETSEELYLLTEQKLIKMRIENCGQYATCEMCIGPNAGLDGDPYCGWCTLNRTCTRYNDCPMPDVSSRWLSYNEPQCIDISNISPYDSLPLTLTEQQITLTVQQLPDLGVDQNYICYFDDQYNNDATVESGDSLTCKTPPADQIPNIMEGEDHVDMQLSILSTETDVKFVDTKFTFYECSTHETCVSCVGSRWACDWCVFENRCTSSSSLCLVLTPIDVVVYGQNNPTTAMEGPAACPQLQAQNGEQLVPNNVQREIIVETSNLPDRNTIAGYQCSLDIDGSPQSVSASRVNSTLTCNLQSYTYTAEEQKINVTLTLEWQDSNGDTHQVDDRYGFTVTLYKCTVLRPDCSRCVSEETSRQQLGCVWCGSSCNVDDSELCTTYGGQTVTADNMINCPDPVIQEIYPLHGPIEGNTILRLTGTDLGRRFTDVADISIGGPCKCNVQGLQMKYSTGASVSCITDSNMELTPQGVVVNITGANGDAQLSQGDKSFQYKNPSISDFNPKRGAQSGGTSVTITGASLDAGRYIEGMVGNMSCTVQRDRVSDSSLICVTSKAYRLDDWMMSVTFDGASRPSGMTYSYAEDPTVRTIEPLQSVLAGGRKLTVNGTGFSIIQKPQILITAFKDTELVEFTGDCKHDSDTIIFCTSPAVDVFSLNASDSSVNVSTGFIMDAVVALRKWSKCGDPDRCQQLQYFPNPVYFPFDNPRYNSEDGVGVRDGETLILFGENLDLAITNSEVSVFIGQEDCTNISVDNSALSCKLPEKQPAAGDNNGLNTSRNLPIVTVMHGEELFYTIGYFRYPVDKTLFNIIIAVVVSVVVLATVFILACVLFRKSRSAQREVDDCLDDMDKAHDRLAGDMRTAFAELQTDVTDLTSDLDGVGMPFCSHREYATHMLFYALETKPLTTDPEYPEEHVERAMKKFLDLLNNKAFLLVFIQTLDAQSKDKLPVRKKAAIASLLTVVMMDESKLGYLTDVLFTLMAKRVQDELDNNRPRQLFRRTETILEKLLSNWIALCLYDSLKNYTAYPLFLLYRAIKCHCEHGPIDSVSGQAKFTLSNDKLLTVDIDYNEMTMKVANDEDGETIDVKVLDVDTISQVKEKILDAIHRNKPYSNRPSANQVDLEFRRSGRLTLKDLDITTPNQDGWKKTNTLKFYNIPDNSEMALVPLQSTKTVNYSANSDSASEGVYVNQVFTRAARPNVYKVAEVAEVDTEEGTKLWHLVKVEEDDNDAAAQRKRRYNRRMSGHPKKKIREIYITRLIGTKGTIQEYIDRMFEAILDADTIPLAVKYLFDFFDSQAVRHDIQDTDAVRIWKGNSLPLRFWSNAIRHPEYIFDVRPSRPVEASLGVIAQAFYDAHNTADQKLSKDSDLSKLLFNKELPVIEGRVSTYYEGISNRPRATLMELNLEMKTTCESFTGLFSKLSTLLQLWECTKPFNTKIVEELEDNEDIQNEHLPYKLVEVETTLSNEDCDDEHPV